MTRFFQIPGETMVFVEGNGRFYSSGDHGAGPVLYELGVCSERITIQPRILHDDVRIDDFGPKVPPELMYQLTDVYINMTLVNFDLEVSQKCVAESMGGSDMAGTGKSSPAGTMMQGMVPSGFSGNHFVTLYLVPTTGPGYQYRFPAATLTQPYMLEYPLGTDRQLLKMGWRAIPYKEYMSGLTALYEVDAGTEALPQTLKNFFTLHRFSGEPRSDDAVIWDQDLPEGYSYDENGFLIVPDNDENP